MSGIILSTDVLRERLGLKGYKKLLGTLTVRQKLSLSQSKYGFPLTIHAYRIDGKSLIIPRTKRKAVDRMSLTDKTPPYDINDAVPIDVVLQGDLYDYQTTALDYVLETAFAENENCCYFSLMTGGGKTRWAIAVIAALSLKTIVVIPAKSLQSQWQAEFLKVAPETRVVAYGNPKGEYVDCDVAICVINTFRGKTPAFLRDNGFGLIIFDEAHEYYTRMNSNALWLAQGVEYVLGLSATPLERQDLLDTYVCHFLGKPVRMEDIPGAEIDALHFPGHVTRVKYECDLKYADVVLTQNGTPCHASTLALVLSDPTRQKLVAAVTYDLFRKGHGIFVFAEHRDYLLIIQDLLNREGLEPCDVLVEDAVDEADEAVDLAVLRGGVKAALLNTVRKKGARVVLTTYGYSRRGVSLPRMTAMVLASPRRNGLMQILGRITRKGDDASIVREVVDIVDVNTMYKNQFYDRNKVYKLKEWPVSTEEGAQNELAEEASFTEDTFGHDIALH